MPQPPGRPARRRRPSKAGQPAYIMPRHPSEIDRLDVQHYAARALLQANYLAPLDRPASVLDVGAGTGQWAYDLGAEFPQALVVGLDLVPSKKGGPANYRCVKANLLDGLPFADDRFDFVHQRLLVAGIPVVCWPTVVADLVRVTRPGGWVELVEPDAVIQPAGPSTARLFELLMRLTRSRDLDSTGIVFRSLDEYLRRAGSVDVERRPMEIPIGEWGGRVGSLMASDVRALFTLLADAFEARFAVPVAESRQLVRTMLTELEHHRSSLAFAVAFGRKPSS